jgi:hypothetical protein
MFDSSSDSVLVVVGLLCLGGDTGALTGVCKVLHEGKGIFLGKSSKCQAYGI